MSASVVYSFPAIRSVARCPLSRSRRNPDSDMEPSGNAIFAATAKRRGVSNETSSSFGAELCISAWFHMTALVRFNVK
jgi:hypothetical protein